MTQIQKFRLFNKLKTVTRLNSVDGRKESPAEHSWSSLLLADFFLSQCDYGLDRLKVYELILYHDVIEIEVGDTPLHPNMHTKPTQAELADARVQLVKDLPEPLNTKFDSIFSEFSAQQTKEAQFVKAIDALDPLVHELDYKADWKGWSAEFLREKKLSYLEPFPEMKEVFLELLAYMEEQGYFRQ